MRKQRTNAPEGAGKSLPNAESARKEGLFGLKSIAVSHLFTIFVRLYTE